MFPLKDHLHCNDSIKEAEMVQLHYKQIKAAVAALRNTRGLTWPPTFETQRQKGGDLDLLDWLRSMFGFQVCWSYFNLVILYTKMEILVLFY